MTIEREEIEQSLRQLRPEPQPLSKDERRALRHNLFTQLDHRKTNQMKHKLNYIPSAFGFGALLLVISLLVMLLNNDRLGTEGAVNIQAADAQTATAQPIATEPTSLPSIVIADRTVSVIDTTPPTGEEVVIDAQTAFSVTVAYNLESLETAELQVKLTEGNRGVGGANLTIARGSGEVTVIIRPDYQELGNAERLGLWLTLLDPTTGEPIFMDFPVDYYWIVTR